MGYRRGGGRRYRRRLQWWPRSETLPPTTSQAPEGWTYVGPCRCGWGPHAYWRTPEGEIVHTLGTPSTVPTSMPPILPEEEIEDLKEYASQLEKDLEEIKKRIEDLKRIK